MGCSYLRNDDQCVVGYEPVGSVTIVTGCGLDSRNIWVSLLTVMRLNFVSSQGLRPWDWKWSRDANNTNHNTKEHYGKMKPYLGNKPTIRWASASGLCLDFILDQVIGLRKHTWKDPTSKSVLSYVIFWVQCFLFSSVILAEYRVTYVNWISL